MNAKRFWTDYPRPGVKFDGEWRAVLPVSYDGDKYVTLDDGQEIKLGYLRHGHPGGPMVTSAYANRYFMDVPPPEDLLLDKIEKWHNSGSTETLAKYLGLSDDMYAKWVTTGQRDARVDESAAIDTLRLALFPAGLPPGTLRFRR